MEKSRRFTSNLPLRTPSQVEGLTPFDPTSGADVAPNFYSFFYVTTRCHVRVFGFLIQTSLYVT